MFKKRLNLERRVCRAVGLGKSNHIAFHLDLPSRYFWSRLSDPRTQRTSHNFIRPSQQYQRPFSRLKGHPGSFGWGKLTAPCVMGTTKTDATRLIRNKKPVFAYFSAGQILLVGYRFKTKQIVLTHKLDNHVSNSPSDAYRGFAFLKDTISKASAAYAEHLFGAFSDFITYIHFRRLITLLSRQNPAISYQIKMHPFPVSGRRF